MKVDICWRGVLVSVCCFACGADVPGNAERRSPDRASAGVDPNQGVGKEREEAAGQVFRDCSKCPEMVVVPAGSFMMGSPDSEEGRVESEGPMHRVTVDEPFAAGAYEVTFEEWDHCVSEGGCGG